MRIYFFVIIYTLVFSFETTGDLYAQQYVKTADIPEYIMAEGADPIVFITAMNDTEVVTDFETILTPNRDKSSGDYSNKDEATLNALIVAIDNRLKSLNINPQGYVFGSYATTTNQDKMEDLIIDYSPHYSITFTIMNWSKITSGVEKNNGICELDMVVNPIVTISLIGEVDVSSWYMNMKGKNLETTLSDVEKDIKKKGDDYFVDAITDKRDIKAIISKNEEVSKLWYGESALPISETWPSESTLESAKFLVVCEDHTKKDKFMKFATNALDNNFPFDYDMVTFGEMVSLDLSKYDYALIPKQKSVTKTWGVDKHGKRTNGAGVRTESGTYIKYYYQMKFIENNQVFLGPEPQKITGFSGSNYPYALRRFMRIFAQRK